MTNILTKATVLVLNRNWQAITVRTPQEAFCMMATNVATALEIEFGDARNVLPLPVERGQVEPDDEPDVLPLPKGEGRGEGEGIGRVTNDVLFDANPTALEARSIRPVTWDEWITLPIRPHDNAVHTVRGQIRVPTVIVAVNFARVPRKRPKLSPKTIRERDGNRCQYTGALLRPEQGSLDHVLPRSRGGRDTWENLVWSSKDVNARKANRLPHEAGLKLLKTPRAPKELPASAFIRNAHRVTDWHLFVKE
jgi:5-methylcytosine-specific restriction endonuclease McrA